MRHEYEWDAGQSGSVTVRGATGEDLALTLDLTDGTLRGERVTALMNHCVSHSRGDPISEAEIDSLVLGDRNRILAELVRMTFGNEVDLQQRCSDPECAYELEWPIHMSDLLGETERLSRLDGPVIEGHQLTVRPATVGDERRVRGSSDPIRTLVELCVDPYEVVAVDDDDVMKRIEAALEELDPLASIEFTFSCYACGEPLRSALDLPHLLLDLLHVDDMRRPDDHHLLASGYGWSPSDLLGLRPAERSRFAATLIDLWVA